MRLLAFTLLLPGSVVAFADNIRVESGTISGIDGSTPGMRIYKGIPYAAPPVGDLRWKAPKPAAHWDGVHKADDFGPECMQIPLSGPADQKMSEDCLTLNVWTAAKSFEKRPVMVWIYGGGYYVGAGSLPDYDGENLAHKGPVVVTFNYRLGPLGFFAHPELTKESDRRGAENFGMMDSIAALKWVRANIAAFGGDPNNVTIFGESAGGGMVANLMVSPQAKGLFHRAMAESSAWNTLSIGRLPTLASAEQTGIKQAAQLNAKSPAELRAKPAREILELGHGTGPVVDGWLIPADPAVIFAQGKPNDVPVLLGSNRDESTGGVPASLAAYVESARKKYGELADNFLKAYPATTDDEAREAAFTAGRDEVAWVMRNWARLVASKGKNKAYVYFFTHQPPATPGGRANKNTPFTHGTAVHASEIVYVFNTLHNNNPRNQRAWTDTDNQVAGAMSSYWVNFAASADPNGNGLPKWVAYDGAKNKSAMVFGDKPEMGPAPDDNRMAVFQAYYDRLVASVDNK